MAKDENKVKAGKARWSIPLEGFRRLWRMRGGFVKGCRHSAVYLYAVLLRKNRIPGPKILSECFRLAASCNPPLTAEDVRRCVKSSSNVSSHLQHYAFVRLLGITRDEIRQLPNWFRPSKPNRVSQINHRRAVILSELERAGYKLPVRAMAQLLSDRHEISVSYATIHHDYKAIEWDGFAGTNGATGSNVVKSCVLVRLNSLSVQAGKT